MDRYSFASPSSAAWQGQPGGASLQVAGAMEMGADPVPPVPPDLDLDLDLEIDFDSLPEIDLPEESPVAKPKEAPKAEPARASAPGAADEAQAPPGRASLLGSRAWWPLLGGLLTLLVIALVSIPFALVRLGDMSRDMTRLSDRVEAAETENDHLHDKLAREAADAVAERLVETDRRIDRVRCALDDVRHAQAPSQEAARPTPPAVAKAPGPEGAPPKPAPIVEEPPHPHPLVGASKPKPEPIEPASAMRTKPVEAPPIPPKPPVKKPGGDGRIHLPTELYGDDE